MDYRGPSKRPEKLLCPATSTLGRIPLSKLKHLPFHPFLFSAYPILALFAINIDQIRSNAVAHL
jgi:hypothetical protein